MSNLSKAEFELQLALIVHDPKVKNERIQNALKHLDSVDEEDTGVRGCALPEPPAPPPVRTITEGVCIGTPARRTFFDWLWGRK